MKHPFADALRHGQETGDRPAWNYLSKLSMFWQIARATVREIFDEGAYERFLARTRRQRSTASYREFLREQDESIAQRPKCC